MPDMTAEEAQAHDWPSIEIGGSYEFVAEVMEEYEPEGDRLRERTGQTVTVLERLPSDDPDSSPLYTVRFNDGREASAWQEELNGWDKALGQFYGPSGIWGDPS